MVSWSRFLVNSWFWVFATLAAWWHIAEAVHPSDAPFFLGPCVAVTCIIAPLVWLGGFLVQRLRDEAAYREERSARKDPWWENYSRQHNWKHLYDTNGFFTDDPAKEVWTRVIQCTRCAQTRRIWAGCDVSKIKWGCAKIPWLGQLTHPVIPAWDVNSRPPWV